MTHVDIAATIAPEDKLSKTLLKDIKVNEESIDIIELRIDQWPSFNKALLNEVIKQLKIFHLKILVTYRTSVQGGKGAVNVQEYLNILGELIECPQFDMIDIEWSSAVKIEKYTHLVQRAQQKGLEVVLSHHNFQETPALDELKFIYFKMQKLNPEYLKLAVMPKCQEDVLHLLEAMSLTAKHTTCRIVGISMSSLGKVSRIAQGVFGGTLSYGCIEEPQAPGQIHVSKLKSMVSFYED